MSGKEFVTVVKSTASEFIKDDVGYLAAALTYYAFFSLFPLILLAVTITGIFFHPNDVYNFIFTQLGLAPSLAKFMSGIFDDTLANRNNVGWSALFGVVVLIVTATGAFDALDKAINRAWNSERVPSLIVSKLTSLAMMLVMGGLLLVSLVMSVVLTTVRTFTTARLGEVPGTQIVWALINFAASTAIVFLVFLVLYRYIPRSDITFRDVYFAALFAAFVWAVAKEGFALYLGSSFARYSTLYGTVGTIIALLTWIYVSSLIILAGAEFASETTRVRNLRAAILEKPEMEISHSPWFS